MATQSGDPKKHIPASIPIVWHMPKRHQTCQKQLFRHSEGCKTFRPWSSAPTRSPPNPPLPSPEPQPNALRPNRPNRPLGPPPKRPSWRVFSTGRQGTQRSLSLLWVIRSWPPGGRNRFPVSGCGRKRTPRKPGFRDSRVSLWVLLLCVLFVVFLFFFFFFKKTNRAHSTPHVPNLGKSARRFDEASSKWFHPILPCHVHMQRKGGLNIDDGCFGVHVNLRGVPMSPL